MIHFADENIPIAYLSILEDIESQKLIFGLAC